MAKQLNVSLGFTADTSKAKAEIQSLQQSLDQLIKGSVTNKDLPLTDELIKAQSAAASLKVALDSAVNTNTGNLDLTKFNESMKKSGMSLTELGNNLSSLGPAGQQTFLSLTKSILSAEVPIRRTNAMLSEMWTTMKNTARWQISSSILHGFMGTISSAYGYAQDLNESLNNIRIVTGQNVDQMDAFADRANKAAKALSTTTTAYTNAALIYYQQGLDDTQVEERTNTTVKLSNVAGIGAEEASDQLTAIWNNFYDGSQTLEHYADVLVRLGADTASSSDEISVGMEKFAAVADMIGLSYENAAAALATVTATTRQSADTVGTAFRTIFARIQGLSLGETLDDGTDLNKYSKALDSVGISIKDQNGELKDMDTLLSEMMDKWETLAKDQQVALAQTVAGVRQYSQLVALMDNQDFYRQNLASAQTADGSLNEQAKIYEESWAAASKRVRAALEDIFDSIISDDFFIDITNGFAGILDVIGTLADSLNGLPGILSLVGVLITKIFSKQLEASIDNMVYGLKSLTGINIATAAETRSEAINAARGMTANDGTMASEVTNSAMMQQIDLQELMIDNEARLSEHDKARLKNLLDINKAYAEQAIQAAKAQDAAEQQLSDDSSAALKEVKRNAQTYAATQSDDPAEQAAIAAKIVQEYQKLRVKMNEVSKTAFEVDKAFKGLSSELKESGASFQGAGEKIKPLTERLRTAGLISEEAETSINQLADAFDNNRTEQGAEALGNALNEIAQGTNLMEDAAFNTANEMINLGEGNILTAQTADGLASSVSNVITSTDTATQSVAALTNHTEQVRLAIQGAKDAAATFSQNVVKIAGGISQLGMGINSLVSMFSTLNNQDMSFGEKLLSVIMSLSMAIPMLIGGIKSLTTVKMADIKADLLKIATGLKSAAAAHLQAVADGTVTTSIIAQTVATWGLNTAMSPLLFMTLAIVAAIGLLVGVAVGLVAIFNAISNAYNADAIAAESAEKAANNLAEAYTNAKQEYEAMITAMENYKTARDGLDSLTKGTEEYNTALKEANRQALELIQNYPQAFSPEDYAWEDGVLNINDEAMARVQKEQEAELDQSYAASMMANVKAREMRSKSDQTDLIRSMQDDASVGTGTQVASDIMNGITAGLGLVLAPFTAGASLIATGAALYNDSSIDQKAANIDSVTSAALEKYQEDSNLFSNKEYMAQELSIDDQDLIDALWANRDELASLGNEMIANTEAQKIAAQNAANELMAGSGYENTEAGAMALEAGGRFYDDIYSEAYDKYLTQAEDRGWFNTGTDESKAAFEAYAKEAGLSDLKNFEVTNYKGDGTVEYTYIDDEGEEQKKLATAEEIAAVLATADAAKELESSLSILRDKISELNSSEDLSDQALAEFLSAGNLEGATKGQFDALQEQVDIEGIDSVLGLTGNAADDLLLAESMGYESAQAYRDAFTKALDVDWEIPAGLGENIADKLTLGASEKINKTYKDMGEVGGEAYLDSLNIIADSIDWDTLTPSEQEAAWDKISNIDWSSWDAAADAEALVSELGGSIDKTSTAWDENADAMRDAANAVPDLTALKENLEAVKEVASDIELGSILAKEDYDLLVAYNSELSKYFAILSDGSAQMIGDPLDLQQDIKESTRQDLIEAAQRYQDEANQLQAIFDSGVSVVGGNKNNVDQYRDTENYVGDDGNNYYSGQNVNTQLDFLASQGFDQTQLDTWSADLADGSTTTDVLEDIAAAVNETSESFLGAEDAIATYQGQYQLAMNEIALGAESAAEAQQLFEDGIINEAALNKSAEARQNAEKWQDLDTDEVEDYAKYVKKAAKESDLLSDELEGNIEAAEDVAAYTLKMNKGIDKLADGFEDWSDVLKKSDKGSQEYMESMDGIRDAMSDVLGVQDEFLSDDFILQNMDDIEKAANGDAEAIDRLATAAGKDILVNLDLQDESIREELYALHDSLAAEIPNIEVGATLDSGDFLTEAARVVEAAGMSVDEANAYFRSMGFEPHFKTESVDIDRTLKGTRTYTENVKVGVVDTGNGPFQYIESMDQRSEEVDLGTVTEKMQVPALTTDGSEPNFTLTRTNSGSMNNYSSSNPGGKSPGGGGGGGGSSSKPKTKEYKESNDEVERYHEVALSLDDVATALSNVGKAKDRAWGRDKQRAIQQELALLKEEQKVLEQYAAEVNAYMAIDQQKLAAYGATFNTDANGTPGNINNYDEIMAEQLRIYNAAVDTYNATMAVTSLSEAEQEKAEKAFEAAEKAYEDFIEALERYEETELLQDERIEAIKDNLNSQIDLKLEDLSYEIELNLNINQDDMDWLDWQLEKLENVAFSAAEAIGYLGNSLDVLQATSGTLSDGWSALQALADENGTWTSDMIDELDELKSTAYDTVRSLLELKITMSEKVMEAVDESTEKLDKNIDRFDTYVSMMDHYKNILDLTGTSFENMGLAIELANKGVDIAIDKLGAAQSKANVLQNALAEARTHLAEAQNLGNEEMIQNWEDNVLELEIQVEESVENVTAMWEDALSAAGEAFDYAVEQAIAKMESGLSEFQRLEDWANAVDKSQAISDRYLESYEQVYELSKLTRKVEADIDKYSSLSSKTQLLEIIEEINAIEQDNVRMSEYDLEYLQKKYDLKLAEIALEDAQNAKDQVRLSKDEDGNWNYVYTADQDSIDTAQQNYEDKLYELYKLSDDYLDELSSQIISNQQELSEALAGIHREDYENEETYRAALAETAQYYVEIDRQLKEEMTKAIANMKSEYFEEQEVYAQNTAAKIEWLDKYELRTENLTENIDQCINEMCQAYVQWQEALERAHEQVGTSSDDLADTIKENSDQMSSDSQDLANDIRNDADDINDYIQSVMNKVANWQSAYLNSVNAMIQANEALIRSMMEVKSAQAGADSSVNDSFSGGPDYSALMAEYLQNGGDMADAQYQEYLRLREEKMQQAEWSRFQLTADSFNNFMADLDKNPGMDITKFQDSNGYWDFEKIKAAGYDTGGYTGEWGNQGKFAVLHEKEIVLNKNDTANFLQSIDLVRNLIKEIDLNSRAAQLSSILATSTSVEPTREVLTQDVTIQASFPAVTERNEIEEALNNLINDAAQYISHK